VQIYKNGANGLNASLHLDTFSFVYTAAAAASGCDYTLTLNDQYNDGWTNSDGSANNIDVLVNGVVVSNHTISGGSESFAIAASYGDVVSLSYNVAGSGNWAGENSFVVTDADGATVTSGNSSSNGESFECLDPNQVNLAVSATTDGGSATFTFDIANFTVGAAAGEGDGHIHWSIFAASDLNTPIYENVMVYSTDDLTLSPLPNGDHVIVFSLVDPNHQPLDPAVEATVEFSTFDGTVACDGSYSYTYGNNEDPSNVIFSAVNEGGTVTVTVAGSTENNYDDLVVTNGAGEVLYSASGDHTGQVITSNDGTINVAVDSDSSVSGETLDFAVTCGAAQTLVTFSVNTENITVGENGMYAGGGVLGNAMAYMMTDDDADGTYEVTVSLDTGITGNYIFINSPANGDDYNGKENLDGQECADPNNWNDRILPEITGDAMTLLHCFGECSGNGTGECPAAVETHDVTFSVDTANYPGGLADTDQLYVSGNLNGWSGDANPMSDDDGDGIWEVTIALADGDYEYKFTMNNWAVQEEFGAIGAVEGCTVSDGTFVNRSLTVAGEDMVLPTVYWNLCPGETPGEVYNVTFNLDATGIDVGANGMYMGGGILGGANAVPMSDDDGDGIWTVTVEISTDQIGGNYTFLNSPNDGGDWNAKEDISGQDCADADNYNDRIVPEFTGDAEFCYVFAVCTDGTCADGMMMLQGILDLDVPSAGSDGKAIHVLVTEDIADLSSYGLGVANNGGGTDGQEYTFPEGSATAGQHILIARSAEAMEAYGITGFDLVLEASSDISQNGDDAIELYFGGSIVETFGDADTDGSGEAWEYTDSWAYMVDGVWVYGGVDCSDDTTTTCESSCPYPFSECAGPVTFPICEDFEGEDGTAGWTFIDAGGATSDWLIDTPANSGEQSIGHGYLPQDVAYNDWAVSPSYDTSSLSDATVSYYEYLNWSADAQAHNVYYTLDYAGDATTATWVLLTDVIGTDAEDVYVQRTFSIPSAESVVIGFQYLNTYGADWNIDDVCIDGTLSTTNTELLDMRIYPNPVDGNYVTIQSPVQGVKEIEVYTVTGRKVLQTVLTDNKLDVSSFNSGFYMVKVTINGQSKLSKLIVR
jgi:hypothetical protein